MKSLPTDMTETIALLGAGSWGTAIAIHLAKAGHEIRLWSHKKEHVEAMSSLRANPHYLAHVPFPETLIPTASIEQALNGASHLLIGVPSHAFSPLLEQLPQSIRSMAWLTKGLDPNTNQLLSEVVAQRYGTIPMAMISGPSFANEVALSLPTAITIASNESPYARSLQHLFHHHHLRAYLSDDLIGVQLCGAIKNVLAIACGISDGLGYGANAKAALITRGLAEMTRLGKKLGAKQETFMGLSGVGDLVLTCTDDQSRNRRFGLLLGSGLSSKLAEKTIGQVVEGKYNAPRVCAIAQAHHIEMPICEQISALLDHKLDAKQAVSNLMSRPARGE